MKGIVWIGIGIGLIVIGGTYLVYMKMIENSETIDEEEKMDAVREDKM